MSNEGALRVRVATVDDAAGIAQVRVRGWQAGYDGIVPSEILEAMSIEADARRVREWDWSTEAVRSWVCSLGEETVGWTSAMFPARDADGEPGVGEIAACYAVPEVWGMGVGHRMAEVAVAWLRGAGADSVTLWVLEQNERAQRFYRRQGFELDGRSKQDPMLEGTQLRSVRMRRRL